MKWASSALLFISLSTGPSQFLHHFSSSFHILCSVLSVWTVVISFWAPSFHWYLSFSLYVDTETGRWGGLDSEKKKKCLLIEKPIWLSSFLKHRKGFFEEYPKLYISTKKTSTKAVKLQNEKKPQCFCDRCASVLSNINLQYKKGY